MDSSINYITILFVVLGIITFLPGLVSNYGAKYTPTIFLKFFRYGRANMSKAKDEYGFLKKIEVPKKWFYHVYIYAIFMQSIIVYTVATTYRNGSQESWLKYLLEKVGGNARAEKVDATTTLLVAVLFFIQLSRRLYETLFVCVYSNTKMNFIHYFLTYAHYTGCMLTIPAYGPVFSSGTSSKGDLTIRWSDIGVVQYVAIAIFVYGSWVQYQAHVGLASLRKGKENKVVTLKHQIPRGGLFDTISCPNYWGEILVYSAIAILFHLQNCTWNFVALWVIGNQITTGVMNHQWYQDTFKDYPKNRKAVIPWDMEVEGEVNVDLGNGATVATQPPVPPGNVKGGKKTKKKERTGRRNREICDVFGEPAMLNAYNISHNVQGELDISIPNHQKPCSKRRPP